MLQRTITIDDITPTELALIFSEMNNEQQATFFNELARLTDKWKKPFCFQLQSIIDSPVITNKGRSIMEEIGQYGA